MINAIINYAHRGASAYYPENTMLSFQKAIEMGCTGIETDVQMTKDGVLVLMHDESVRRTTNGMGMVKDYTYSEISKLDAGSWKSRKFKGVKVPAAEELFYYLRNKNIILNIELKTGMVIYEGIEEKTIDMIYKYNMQNKVILSSFNHYSLAKCKQISKEIKTGVLYMEGFYKPYNYAKTLTADAIHPYYYAINEEVIKESQRAGIMVNVFTIDDEKDMKRFVQIGVNGIITNYPDKLKKVMEEQYGRIRL